MSAPPEPPTDGEALTRRGFLGWSTSVLMGAAAMLAFLLTSLRLPLPSLLPGRSRRFKIGSKEDFPPGTSRYFAAEQTYVFADEEGIYAMSATCTHLGCVVVREQERFTCPCHGSRYDERGKVLTGPAPKSLDWYEVRTQPSGRLVVDRGRSVKPGTKLLT